MYVLALLVTFAILALVAGFTLWLATVIVRTPISFREAVIVSVVTALVGMIPYAGWVLALIAFFWLLKRYSGAPIWPDLILTAVVMIGLRALCFFFVLSPWLFARSQV